MPSYGTTVALLSRSQMNRVRQNEFVRAELARGSKARTSDAHAKWWITTTDVELELGRPDRFLRRRWKLWDVYAVLAYERTVGLVLLMPAPVHDQAELGG